MNAKVISVARFASIGTAVVGAAFGATWAVKNELDRRATLRRQIAVGAAGALTLGTAVGMCTGMLLAPKPGRELREDLADKLADMRERARMGAQRISEGAHRLRQSAAQAIAEGAERAERGLQTPSSTLNGTP
jgi:hypothetical protein